MSHTSRTDDLMCTSLRPGLVRAMPSAATAVVVLALSGCMTAKIEENRQAATKISTDEAVVLLAKPHLEGTGTESEFLDCLEDAKAAMS